MRSVFINGEGTVVQVIVGWLTGGTRESFLQDYGKMFGATAIIEVDDSTSVWIGGTYTDGVFAPPPEPEPEPQPEPLPEPQPEPEI